MSACQELPFMPKAAVGSLFSPWRVRLCCLQKQSGVSWLFQRSTSDKAVRTDATFIYLAPLFPLFFLCLFIASSISIPLFLSHVHSLSLPFFLHPSLPPSFPGCLYPAASLLSLFQGWWLWLESLHRWQASLPSGEGLHSLNFLRFFLFSSSPFFSSNFWPATFHAWRVFISPCTMWGESMVLREARGGYLKRLSCPRINRGHQYQWKPNTEACWVSVLALSWQAWKSDTWNSRFSNLNPTTLRNATHLSLWVVLIDK